MYSSMPLESAEFFLMHRSQMAAPFILNKVPPFNTMDPKQVAQIEAALVLGIGGYYAVSAANRMTYALVGAVGGYVLRMYV